METKISKATQLLLESYRLLEQARSKYYAYLEAATNGDQNTMDIYAAKIDPEWNALREKILNEDITQTVYDWAVEAETVEL